MSITKPYIHLQNLHFLYPFPTYKYSSASLSERIRTFDSLFLNIHLKNVYNRWITFLFFTWTTTRRLKSLMDTDFSTLDEWFSYTIPAFLQPLAGPSALMYLKTRLVCFCTSLEETFTFPKEESPITIPKEEALITSLISQSASLLQKINN